MILKRDLLKTQKRPTKDAKANILPAAEVSRRKATAARISHHSKASCSGIFRSLMSIMGLFYRALFVPQRSATAASEDQAREQGQKKNARPAAPACMPLLASLLSIQRALFRALLIMSRTVHLFFHFLNRVLPLQWVLLYFTIPDDFTCLFRCVVDDSKFLQVSIS